MAEPTKEKKTPKEKDFQAKKNKRNRRDSILRGVVKEWNTVVGSLIKASKAWESYCTLRLENNVSIEEFPLECQRALMLANPRGDLDFIVEDMITRGNDWKNYLKTQLIKIK